MDSQQLYRNEQNREDLPQQADATKLHSHDLGPGTDVIGNPVNPLDEPGHATATSHAAVSPASAQTRANPISPTSKSRTPANVPSASPASTGNFPTAQMPQTLSMPANQSAVSQQPTSQPTSTSPYVQTLSVPGATGKISQQPTSQPTSTSPYVQTTSVPGATGKTPMDSIMQVFNKWSKKAEDMTGNVWTHLKTGPNVADTALGRIAMGTKAMTEGGLENVYRQTFDVGPEEHLLKTYACYLSTSTGPVAGTLYISSHKLAFCSDRPLAIPAPQTAGINEATNQPAPSATSTPTNKPSSVQQQQQYCYYKVMVPISQVESVNPSENTQKKPSEKYVQVKTSDGHEFWFMGFVNYDKGVKNLQETLVSKNTGPTTNTTSHVV